MKKKWKNPEFREEMSEKASELMTELWQDPDFRKERTEDITERWKNNEYKKEVSEKISEKQKESFKDPKRLEKHKQMLIDTSPKRAKKMKSKWNDPFFIFKVMKARRNEKHALDVVEERLGYEARLECEKKLKEAKKDG